MEIIHWIWMYLLLSDRWRINFQTKGNIPFIMAVHVTYRVIVCLTQRIVCLIFFCYLSRNREHLFICQMLVWLLIFMYVVLLLLNLAIIFIVSGYDLKKYLRAKISHHQLGFEKCTSCWCGQGWRRFRGKNCFAFLLWIWRGMLIFWINSFSSFLRACFFVSENFHFC